MKRIVITGGPQSGKSTATRALKREFGNKILLIPESATILITKAFPKPGEDIPYSPEWQAAFTNAILPLQRERENAWELVAKDRGIKVVVCDRGIMDNAAYADGHIKDFLVNNNLVIEELYGRYDCVIHLESVAVCNPDLWGKAGNNIRYEDPDRARFLDQRIREAWKSHPTWHYIPGNAGIRAVVKQVKVIVKSYLD